MSINIRASLVTALIIGVIVGCYYLLCLFPEQIMRFAFVVWMGAVAFLIFYLVKILMRHE